MPAEQDFFELFGLARAYEIDRASLDEAYERLSLEHHPDFFTNAPEAEQARAHRTAARLNEGYRVLCSERERAIHLLHLLAGGRELDTQALPEGFLQEMFFLQEEVDELEEDDDPERRGALEAQTGDKLAELRRERARLFAGAGDGGDLERLQQIQTNLNCERYLERLLDRLGASGSPDAAG